MVSPVDRPDSEFICACWEQLVPNNNFQTTSTRGEHGVTGLWTELWGESGQRVWSVRRNQVDGGNDYFSPWGYQPIRWLVSGLISPAGAGLL